MSNILILCGMYTKKELLRLQVQNFQSYQTIVQDLTKKKGDQSTAMFKEMKQMQPLPKNQNNPSLLLKSPDQQERNG